MLFHPGVFLQVKPIAPLGQLRRAMISASVQDCEALELA